LIIKRILIVGLGSIGTRHLKILNGLFPEAEFAILSNKKNSQLINNVSYFENIEQALLFLPQIAVISTPSMFHLESAIPLAKIGVHLLIEKPLSSSVEGVAELQQINISTNVKMTIGYNLRFMPSLIKFKALIDENTIGKVFSIRCEAGQYLPSWRPGKNYKEAASSQKNLGGGVLLELSHELDYLHWIFGEVEWIQASLNTLSDLDIDVEDTAFLLLGFRSEKHVKPIIASVNLDFVRHDVKRSCTAIGRFGSLRWDCLKGTIHVYFENSKSWKEIFKQEENLDDSYIFEWKHFISSIETNRDPLISINEGLKVLEIIEAARFSSSKNQRVYLKDNHE